MSLEQAKEAFDAGNLVRALACVEAELETQPNDLESLHFKGYVLFQQGELEKALTLFESLKSHPGVQPDQLFHLANIYQLLQRYTEAEEIYLELLRLTPEDPDIDIQLGHLYLEQERFEDAHLAYQNALKNDPENISALFAMGALYGRQGKAQDSLGSFEKALLLMPNHPEIHHQIGIAYLGLGQLTRAQSHFEKTLSLEPAHSEALSNLGTTLYLKGEYVAALKYYKQLLEARPRQVSTYQNLGLCFYQLKRYTEALFYFDKALNLEPDNTHVHFELGESLYYLQRHSYALTYLLAFIEQEGTDPKLAFRAHCHLAHIYAQSAEYSKSQAHYELAFEQLPCDWVKLAQATLLKPVYGSNAELLECRKTYLEGLELLKHHPEFHYSDPLLELNSAHLPYQGEDDLAANQALSQVYQALLKDISYTQPCHHPSQKAPYKIGIVSEYLFKHSVTRYFKSVIQALCSDNELEIYLCLPDNSPKDDWTKAMMAQAQHMIELPQDLQEAQDLILDAELDMLCYLDLGMSPWSLRLAHSRLAPIQTLFAGHPVSSGIPTVDYFLSGDIFEPPEADGHYSEKLVRIEGQGVCYERDITENKALDFSALGWDEKANNYLCPMMIFKCHPEMDALIEGILEQDDKAKITFFEPPKPTAHYQLISVLKQRWESTLKGKLDRIQFLPWSDRETFYTLLCSADVLLDTPHFSGVNTAYLALQSTTPMVTLPSPYLRGRWMAGLYQWLGLPELVAHTPEQYVDIAVRLATHSDFNQRIRERTAAQHSTIFEDENAPQAYVTGLKFLLTT